MFDQREETFFVMRCRPVFIFTIQQRVSIAVYVCIEMSWIAGKTKLVIMIISNAALSIHHRMIAGSKNFDVTSTLSILRVVVR